MFESDVNSKHFPRREEILVEIQVEAPISISSSSRSGRLILNQITGVRIPVRSPKFIPSSSNGRTRFSENFNGGSIPSEGTKMCLLPNGKAPHCERGISQFDPE
jgi:hypothetical protein